jgi:membrane protein YqaA with SNARE-associated domain
VTEQEENEDFDPKKSLIKIFSFMLAVFLLLLILRLTLGDNIEYAGEVLIDRFGYLGMFIGTLIMDTLIVPISPDVILFISIAAEISPFWTIFTITLASMIGGHLGYLIGKFLGDRKFVMKRIAPYEKKGRKLMGQYGLWAIIIGAMTPIPFSAVCWLAGMLDMKYPSFLIGVSFRLPRFLLWYIILILGFKGWPM